MRLRCCGADKQSESELRTATNNDDKMAAEATAPTSGEYIVHHLTHAQNAKPASLVDFSVVNYDSVIFSVLLGVAGCLFMWLGARKATSGVPGRLQAVSSTGGGSVRKEWPAWRSARDWAEWLLLPETDRCPS